MGGKSNIVLLKYERFQQYDHLIIQYWLYKVAYDHLNKEQMATVEEEKTATKLKSRKLLVKVEQLTKEVETLKKKAAGKSSGELDDLDRALQDLSSDLGSYLALLSGLVVHEDILDMVFSYLEPDDLKSASQVSR